LNSCSSRYHLKPNAEIFPVVCQALDKLGIKYRLQVSHNDFEKFYVDYIILDRSFTVGPKKDVVRPRIRIHHSYNGKLNNLQSGAWYREVCSNGLSVPYKHDNTFNIEFNNTQDNFDRYESFRLHLYKFLDSAGDHIEKFRELQDRS